MSDPSPLARLLDYLNGDEAVVIALAGILAVGVLLVASLISAWRQSSRLRELLVRQDARLEEQSRQTELRGRSVENNIRALEQRGADQAALMRQSIDARLGGLGEQLRVGLGEHRTWFEQRHGEAQRDTHKTLETGMVAVQKQVLDALTRRSEDLERRVEALTQRTDLRLKEISGQVDKRLDEGFEKTNKTIGEVQQRLVVIDNAQKKITELSTNVVSLQEVLSDKRSRGAFGEMQLTALIRNVMPESSFSLQHTLSNGRIADCVLFLPEPTGTVAIDAKFPKESYDRMVDVTLGANDRRDAERQFKVDIRKHIQDIAGRYILPGETSDGAVMFIPAEAIFAEIHAHHTDLVEAAQRARVWLVSPTTLMAILNTARAVLKDEETRKHVHVIQKHLALLAQDFERFQKRMDQLSRHIHQANNDAQLVHTSAKKITRQFDRIEQVELSGENPETLDGSTGDE